MSWPSPTGERNAAVPSGSAAIDPSQPGIQTPGDRARHLQKRCLLCLHVECEINQFLKIGQNDHNVILLLLFGARCCKIRSLGG